MSLYSQNYYGQPYTNPPVQPPQNGYHHTYQQPYQSIPAHHSAQTMGVYHIDPVTFRRDYANRLAELTINSRPIIQNLSYIAQEYSRFADSVVECIDGHIRRVSDIYLPPQLQFRESDSTMTMESLLFRVMYHSARSLDSSII